MTAASESQPSRWRRSAPLLWTGLAVGLFALATAVRFSCLLGADLTEVAPTNTDVARSPINRISEADHKFIAATVSRNAWTLVHHPTALFDAEFCYPTPKALAYGEPLVTQAVLGVPAQLLSGDPILVFDSTLLLLPLISALGMFLLVREWTGMPAAGIAAGLLYAFHRIKTFDVVHPYLYDHAWTVFALFFARRWFAAGRWRDALGVAASVSLQVLGSVYPLVAAAFVALPLLAWLVWQHGVRRLRPLQVAVVALAAVAAAAFVFTPFLSLAGQGAYVTRDTHLYRPWTYPLPGRAGFLGWSIVLLAPAALLAGRRRSAGGIAGDPRWALLAAVALALSISVTARPPSIPPDVVLVTPDESVFNPYELLVRLVPRANILRGPGGMYSMTLLVTCILAGMGAAALLRLAPARWRGAAAGLVVAVAFLDGVRPTALGLEPGFRYELAQLRPDPQILELFASLAAQGDTGPLLELPVLPWHYQLNSSAMLAAAYHHRETSACYNSFVPPPIQQLAAISLGLPDDEALRRVRELGFATLVLHHEPFQGAMVRQKYLRRTRPEGGAALRLLAYNDRLTALRIEPPAQAQ